MLLLKHEDIVGLLTPSEVIDTVRAALLEQSKGQVQVPTRITIDSSSGHGWLRVMPGILNGSGVMGYKAMHSTPGVGVAYLVALYDLKSGELLAQVDADWITSQRTSATAAVGTDLLARRKIACAGIIGSSEQARAMLAAMAAIRHLPRVKVFSPTASNRERFAREMSEKLGVEIEPVERPEQAVQGCDLVLSVFRAGSEPVVRGDWLDPGAHVVSVSAVRPMARELDDTVWRRCDVVVLDDRDHVFESGDGRSALASQAITRDRAAELWEVVGGSNPGRRREDDVTMFKAVGTALQDLALAKAVYDRARAKGLGQDTGSFPHFRK